MEKKIIDIEKINEKAKNDAKGFVAACEKEYHDKIAKIAEHIEANADKIKVVLLSGPSSSGKTTTSQILIRMLEQRGIRSITVSTDDFFVNRWETPKNADGTYDYESIEATNLELLKSCLKKLINHGSAFFPKYSFITGESIRNGRKVELPKNGIVIVEGIHALNPILTEDPILVDSLKLYICVFSNFAYNGKITLTARELRLTRRILRDCLTRNSSPEQSIDVWKHVINGEELYIKPFIESADFVLDTTHAYEPLVYKDLIMPKLSNIEKDISQDMFADYDKFERLGEDVICEDSLLNEFVIK